MNEDLIIALILSNVVVSFVALVVSFADRRIFMERAVRDKEDLVAVCNSIKEVVGKIGTHTHALEVKPSVGLETGNTEQVVDGSENRF